jgi:hypothetical protein
MLDFIYKTDNPSLIHRFSPYINKQMFYFFLRNFLTVDAQEI